MNNSIIVRTDNGIKEKFLEQRQLKDLEKEAEAAAEAAIQKALDKLF